ncbi:hypothetical protein MGYG_01190 [Nannizzia gypsea CBS 118893]|uniref:Impact N-terminal domain-containing protein n=1 Tax=Arthroderma gypseum (strain ATCC MYA-4604 / CBS 118893) TaxID=535722 RepID=E5QZD6_ARTGP|nr:hypothetical protein MGYG_01190 [Nannizzia gypsea CBS 118893]EFQ98154.1 hypothetical protein MGYG_01190 [Nannizzia gypsea CBS 118893]
MTTATNVQALLRFLTQDARIPLATAIGKVKGLQEAKLLNPEDISKAKLVTVQLVFTETKIAKQVWNAAKRVVKKRALGEDGPEAASSLSPSKKRRVAGGEGLDMTPRQIEESLTLPISTDLEKIANTVIVTNRAPLVLAFAVMSLKYTMPEQPLSSRLSLAQAVVSANSRTKARSLGIDTAPSAEGAEWAHGQPTVKVLGRSISVLRRVGYDWNEERGEIESVSPPRIGFDSKKETVLEGDSSSKSPHAETGSPAHKSNRPSPKPENEDDNLPALWGLDLDSDRKSSDGRQNSRYGGYDSGRGSQSTYLPVFRAEPARDYLLRSFCEHSPNQSNNGKAESKSMPAKEIALSLLLGAIDHVCQSWAPTLSRDDLDRRTWSWYVAVRPEVESNISGWGQKGEVRLSAILDLRKPR